MLTALGGSERPWPQTLRTWNRDSFDISLQSSKDGSFTESPEMMSCTTSSFILNYFNIFILHWSTPVLGRFQKLQGGKRPARISRVKCFGTCMLHFVSSHVFVVQDAIYLCSDVR